MVYYNPYKQPGSLFFVAFFFFFRLSVSRFVVGTRDVWDDSISSGFHCWVDMCNNSIRCNYGIFILQMM